MASVHAAAIAAVACVPVRSPSGAPIGALYLETRLATRPDFADELPTLQAFADQAAIAIENARLLGELAEKQRQLETRNLELSESRARLRESLERRTERLKEVRQELRTTRARLAQSVGFRGLVGQSAAMRRIYALIERVQETDVPVLITGESGTGKEVVARAIHQGSPRRDQPLSAVNCGAIPESILESELFGHKRGAFTGAERDRKGLFLEANQGTLFLDEIGETPLRMQASLLRVLQEGRVRPVGGNEEVPVDVRVIFATNRSLEEAVEKGTFRADLLFRIQVVELRLPPLRERPEDIPLLVDHFLERLAARLGHGKKTLSRAALAQLCDHPLPGNVRQLENLLASAWVISDADEIGVDDFQWPRGEGRRPTRSGEASTAEPRASRSVGAPSAVGSLSPSEAPGSGRQQSERERIIGALEQTGWNRLRAAEVLAMPRRTFYRRLREYGIQ
jgi:transcriptional regulator with GAF, ATPase, and Fis domain